MKKRNWSLAAMILNCLCAVIWIINCILDFTYRNYYDDGLIMLHIFCAIVWSIAAVVWILKYKKEKENQ